MGRPARITKLKEPVHLRQRERKDGLVSLYLDIYQNGVRKNEYLNLYLIPERTTEDRQKNRQTLAVAEKVKAQRIIALQDHGLDNWNTIKRAAMPLEEWLDLYDNEEIALSKSAFTNRKKAHKWVTRYLEQICRPNIKLEDINKDFCRGFINFLRSAESDAPHKKDNKKLSQSGIHFYQSTLTAALNKAVREGIISRNPFSMLEAREKVAKKDKEREFLTMDEIKVLMRTPIDHESMKSAFIFACFTGLRISDIIKLTWDDIKMDNNGNKYVRTQMEKTKEWVTVPLSNEAKKWMPKQTETTDLVFHDLPQSRNTRNKSIKNWVKASGIGKDITFHCSRHTFATLMLSLGGDLYTTSKLLGHKNVSTTEIYAKIIDEKKVKTVSLVDQMFDN